MANAEILANVLGTENTYGTVSGQAAAERVAIGGHSSGSVRDLSRLGSLLSPSWCEQAFLKYE